MTPSEVTREPRLWSVCFCSCCSPAGRHSSAALRVSSWTPHKRYASGPEDDLAFLELQEPFTQNMSIIPLCLPEKDYSENILTRAGREGVVRGGATYSYLSLDDCRVSLNISFLMTNKMLCMQSEASVRSGAKVCEVMSGSPVVTVEGTTAFLTGVFSDRWRLRWWTDVHQAVPIPALGCDRCWSPPRKDNSSDDDEETTLKNWVHWLIHMSQSHEQVSCFTLKYRNYINQLHNIDLFVWVACQLLTCVWGRGFLTDWPMTDECLKK